MILCLLMVGFLGLSTTGTFIPSSVGSTLSLSPAFISPTPLSAAEPLSWPSLWPPSSTRHPPPFPMSVSPLHQQ